MKILLALTFMVATTAFAGGAVVAGGRISALTDSKYKIQAALEAIDDHTVVIGAIEILEGGFMTKTAVKVHLHHRNGGCSALIYDVKLTGGQTGAPSYMAVNPQRATCN